MRHDWRDEIAHLVQVKQALSDADRTDLWEYHLPGIAARPESLAEVEELLGIRLDPGYSEFLRYADGWPSFFQSIDLFGVNDLAGGPRMDLARQAVSDLEPAALKAAGLSQALLLPIAATTVDLDLFVMPVTNSIQRPPIVWLAGHEVDRFETFLDFFRAMTQYNVAELDALRSEER